MVNWSSSATSLSLIQLISTLGTIGGFFIFDFSTINVLLILLGYFLFSCLGMSITMHRYLTHRSFNFKSAILEKIFLYIAVLSGRGSPIGWVYVHRMHHRHSDTEKDPHDPQRITWKVFFPHLLKYGEDLDKRVVRDLINKEHVMIDRYYMIFILLWSSFLFLLSAELFYFFYLIPLTLTYISLNLFVILSHTNGYRNFDTEDRSKNNWFISLILWGEGWHNNHHKYPGNWNTKIKPWELDISSYVIRLIKA